MSIIKLSHPQLMSQAKRIEQILKLQKVGRRCYPIPRGGINAMYALMTVCPDIVPVNTPDMADFFLDDIVDSGNTMTRYCDEFPGKPFLALIDKTSKIHQIEFPGWVVFPWEHSHEGGIEDNVRRIIQFIGDDPNREGLLETPRRVAKAYQEWFSGYRADIPGLFKVFEDGAEKVDNLVIVRNIPVESFCEHHMAQFTGVAHVGYIPDGKIVGLSKIAKLVSAFSHRLQVQERLTNQIADAMQEHLNPKGIGVVIKASHTCMSSRGARVHGTDTVTSAMRGVLIKEASARAEFLSLIAI